ncbi:MAG: hypothetical protein AAF577_14375 [Pseudomonadota bacterium]
MRGTIKAATLMLALMLVVPAGTKAAPTTGGTEGVGDGPARAADSAVTEAPDIDALLGKRVWYEGGTLHLSTLREWSDASDRNRLATAGDWTARMFSPKRLYGMGLNGIRTHAEAIVACVDTVADSGLNRGQRSSSVAMACHLSMLSG